MRFKRRLEKRNKGTVKQFLSKMIILIHEINKEK